MSDSPKDFFDEVTKEINVSPPPSEDTGKTADPLSSAETKIIASPPVKDFQIKIPPKMPEFSEAPKGPQGRVVQESSTPTRMAAPPVPEIPAKLPAATEVPDIDIDLSDEPRESVRTDYGSRSADHTFKSLPSRNEVREAVGDNFQTIGIGLILLVLIGGFYFIFKHRGASNSESISSRNSNVAKSDGTDSNWQMNLNRTWLNFGPAPKSWSDFQKSIDQAMVDLGPVEH